MPRHAASTEITRAIRHADIRASETLEQGVEKELKKLDITDGSLRSACADSERWPAALPQDRR